MKKYLIGLAIILLAFFFRFNNLNWDANFHLHPDERFLTMVGNAMKLPTTANQYFDQKTSLLNPTNVGYSFFVYGRFPLILTKYLAVNLNLDNYNDFTILGRQLSAFFDLLIVLLVFKTVWLLEKHYKLSSSVKYWASFFYAIAVLPIQLSHFFAVDTFLNFFMFGSFYFALRVGQDRHLRNTIISAVFFGLALACKITAIFIFPLNLFFILMPILIEKQSPNKFIKSFFYLIIYLFFSYFTLRFADPYYFANSSFFKLQLNPNFLQNITELNLWNNPKVWFPPGVQWIHKTPILFSLFNLAIFGIGIPAITFILLGMIQTIFNQFLKFKKLNIKNLFQISNFNFQFFIVLFWVLGFFVYQSVQYVKSIRYFFFLYPFLAIFGAIAIGSILELVRNRYSRSNIYYLLSTIFIVIVLLIWPLMFQSIYFKPHSRVAASEWIYKNIPNNALILSEHWDDSLPLPISENFGKQYRSEQLSVFDPDLPVKWQKIRDQLNRGDYYILSSNRGWGSITTVPERFSITTKFYKDLFAEKTQYKKVIEFDSYPSLRYLGIPIDFPDNFAEETFTVYDHPQVIIFKKQKS